MTLRQGLAGWALSLGLVVGAGLGLPRLASAESEAAARKHASKANRLAAQNKCGKAIFAFTRALRTLKDPTLLFNRAECFRKVGRDDEAITDYEAFLAELPQAPNRAAVEARIASLRGTKTGGGRPSVRASLPSQPSPSPSAQPSPSEAAAPPRPGETVHGANPAPAPAAATAAKASPGATADTAGAGKPGASGARAADPGTAGTAAPAPLSPAPATTGTVTPPPAPTAPVRRAERWTD